MIIVDTTCKTPYNQRDSDYSRTGFGRVWDTGVLQTAGFSTPNNVEGTEEDWKEATDYHLLKDGKDVRVGFRVQRGKCWGTFTIRCGNRDESQSRSLTEWDKICRKVDVGNPGPDYWIHAYVSDITAFALTETKTIVAAIREKHCGMNHSNADFFWVSWSDIEKFYPKSL